MAFGLGAGACFYYIALDGSSPSRFTNGRTSRLEEEFLELTGSPPSPGPVRRPGRVLAVGEGERRRRPPALLLSDLYYLDHYGKSAHFPGHAVVLAGYDDDSPTSPTPPSTSFRRPAWRASRWPATAGTRSTRWSGHMLTLPEALELRR